MNDRVILTGVSILIANLFLLFAGTFNNINLGSTSYGYYVFDGIIILGIVIGLAGVFSPPAKRMVTSVVKS